MAAAFIDRAGLQFTVSRATSCHMADPRHVDVVIAGGGFPGLGLALALKQALGPSFRVVVVDPVRRDGVASYRATAIAAAARRFFDALGVWQAVEGRAQPILDMVVTDSRLQDVTRPTFLTFGGEVEEGEPFAHMIEDETLLAALGAACDAHRVDRLSERVTEFVADEDGIAVALGSQTLRARLLVAADGARSSLRGLAGIATSGWNYGQSGIVTTVAHERDHDGKAIEHFLPAGPFAILPLSGRRSSIVWTEADLEAQRLVDLPPEVFHSELEQRFGLELGDISVIAPPRAYPLGLHIARSFIADRFALVGDAAHILHPIAGQGLNLGVRDVAALAECIVDQARLGLDVGGADTLERYQRWRRFDTVAMGIATDGLNRLFSNDLPPVRLLRDMGLGLVDRMPAAKRFFIKEAAGLTGDAPRLMKGFAL